MISIGNLAIIILVFLILFGAKRIPEFMKNLAIGIRSFKKAMSSEDEDIEYGDKIKKRLEKKSSKIVIKKSTKNKKIGNKS